MASIFAVFTSQAWNMTFSFYQSLTTLHRDLDDLLPIINAAVLLGFAQVAQGHVSVTERGHAFAEAGILASKELFREQVLAHAQLVANIRQTLEQKRDGTMRAGFFLDLLDEHYPEAEAEAQFATAVDWGRYAELFEYEASAERLRLPDTQSEAVASVS